MVSKSKSFQIIEMEANLATAVNKEPFSFRKMFLRCLPFNSDSKHETPNEATISAIRLQITVNEAKCCRKIAVKGLYGDQVRLQEFTQAFKDSIQEAVERIPQRQRVSVRAAQTGMIGKKKKGGIMQFA